MANSLQADMTGSRIMKQLRQTAQDLGGKDVDLKFFGYGGQWMKEEGLQQTVDIDVSVFPSKEFYTYRKTKTWSESTYYRWYFLNFITKNYTRQTNQGFDILKRSDFVGKVYQERPHLLLNIDNEYLTFKLMQNVKDYYQERGVLLPQRHYYNRFVKDMRQWALKYVDFMHWTVPLVTGTFDGFQFPGEYAGQYGAYEAIKRIYEKVPELSNLINEETLYVSKEHFGQEMEKGIAKIRKDFRQKHQIEDDTTVIFLAPGNDLKEAQFCIDAARLGVNEFLLKYSNPTSLSARAPPLDKFCIVMSIHKKSGAEMFIKNELESKEWKGRVVVVDENEDVESMCGSDFGMVYDGQMVSKAVVCHLPVGIMFNMRMHHQWYHDLYNRWWNDMVITADNNIYPELIGGEVWKGRICDQMAEWYLKPELRFDLIKKWEYFIKDALSFQDINRENVKTRDLILDDGLPYLEFKEPFQQVSKHMLNDAFKYNSKENPADQDFMKLRVEIPQI